jgi:hypothetical protein
MAEQIPHRNNRRGVETLYRWLQPPRRELRVGRAGEVQLTLLLLLLLLSLWFWSDLDVRDLLESRVSLSWRLEKGDKGPGTYLVKPSN